MGIAPGNVQYNYAQLQSIWIQAGGSPQQAPLAAAVAMAESGGNSTAFNQDSNGSIDRGLWQINSSHGAASTYDVMGNARAAVQISCNGNCTNSCSLSGFTGWGNWTTFCSGAYRQFMQGGVAPQPAPTNGTQAAQNNTTPPANADLTGCSTWQWILSPGGCAAGGIVSGTEGIAGNIVKGIVGAIVNPFIEIVAGVMGIIGGGILMIAGVYVLMHEGSSEVKQAPAPQQQSQGGFFDFMAPPPQQAQSNGRVTAGAAGPRSAWRGQAQQNASAGTQQQLRMAAMEYPPPVA